MLELGIKAFLLSLAIAHIAAYKENYMRIGISYAGTFVLKRLAKVAGQQDNAQLLGLAGYSIMAGEIFILINKMLNNGIAGTGKSIVNYIGDLVEMFSKRGGDLLP